MIIILYIRNQGVIADVKFVEYWLILHFSGISDFIHSGRYNPRPIGSLGASKLLQLYIDRAVSIRRLESCQRAVAVLNMADLRRL